MEEASFPPRCRFEEAAREFETNPKDRVYCSNRSCSKFLGNASVAAKSKSLFSVIATQFLCASCNQRTCSRCREESHPGRTFCEHREDTEVVQELLKANGWQRCPRCRRVVELTLGCFHITCSCKEEFCYCCAAPWKTCSCPQWEERNLYAEAARQVDAQIENENNRHGRADNDRARDTVRARDLVARRNRIEQAANRLRHDHVCRHHWQRRMGGGRCNHCGDRLRDNPF